MGRHDHGAAGQPGLDRPGHADDGGRVEQRGRLVEQQDRGRTQGRGPGPPVGAHPRSSVSPSCPSGVARPRGSWATRPSNPTTSHTASSASSVAAPAPRRRFSATDAVKRDGRWGTRGEMGPPLARREPRQLPAIEPDGSRGALVRTGAGRRRRRTCPLPRDPPGRDPPARARMEAEASRAGRRGRRTGRGVLQCADRPIVSAVPSPGVAARPDTVDSTWAGSTGSSAARARTSSTRAAAA